MMRHYFLTSKRMGFSHWLADDASLADMLWGNSDVARFICAGGSLTQRQIADRLVLEMDNQRQFGVQYWPVFLLDNQQFTGCCGLRPYQLQPLVYEIGVHLLPDYWKQGLAAEALQAVMDYAQRDRGATGLFAGHHPQNEASHRLLTRLGFALVGEEFYPPTGLMHPSYRFSFGG